MLALFTPTLRKATTAKNCKKFSGNVKLRIFAMKALLEISPGVITKWNPASFHPSTTVIRNLSVFLRFLCFWYYLTHLGPALSKSNVYNMVRSRFNISKTIENFSITYVLVYLCCLKEEDMSYNISKFQLVTTIFTSLKTLQSLTFFYLL